MIFQRVEIEHFINEQFVQIELEKYSATINNSVRKKLHLTRIKLLTMSALDLIDLLGEEEQQLSKALAFKGGR